MTALKKQDKEILKSKYINRELSWLKFNDRVLLEAQNIENPLYERIKFLSIAGSNLDEFFMVRVAGLYSQIKQEVDSLSSDGLTPDEQMSEVILETNNLLNKQNKIYRDLILQLKKANISIVKPENLSKSDQKRLFKIFNEEIYPLLTPSAIDPAHPFPFIANQGRALVMRLNKKNKKRTLNAIIVIPKALSRFIEIDGNKSFKKFLIIDDVISFFASEIFPDHDLDKKMLFRVIRDSDVEIQEEAEDLVRSFELALKRRIGNK